MAVLLALALAFTLSITPSLSQSSCYYSSAACRGKTISGSTAYCYDQYACYYSVMTYTSSVRLYGRQSGQSATITAPTINAYSLNSAYYATMTATTKIVLRGDHSGYGSTITSAPEVQVFANYAASSADITADYVWIAGYRGAYAATITATTVDVFAQDGGYATDFYPKTDLTINFDAFHAGYQSDIFCENKNCTVKCKASHSCYDVMFYCVGDGECVHSQQCGDDTGESEYCLKFYKEGVDGLTAVDIYELYKENKKRRHAPSNEEPPNNPNAPDGGPDAPAVPIRDYYFSLTTGQFVILCGLMVAFISISAGGFIWTFKNSKKNGMRVTEKEDFQ